MPTISRSSPTTTNAVNENRRPPLTTLATRLISTTRSWRSRPVALTERSVEKVVMAKSRGWLNDDPGLGQRLCEGAHVAVVEVAPGVEHRFGDARRFDPLC